MSEIRRIALSGEQKIEHTPAVLEHLDPKPVFILNVPTWAERDEIGIRGYVLGMSQVSAETIRAHMIDQLYQLKGEEQGEADAIFLEQFWAAATEHEEAVALWTEQETQRILDCREKKLDPDADPETLPEELRKREFPKDPNGPRQRSKAKLLTEFTIQHSVVVRDQLADSEYAKVRQRTTTLRLGLAGWTNVDVAFETDPATGILTEAALEKLRQWLPKPLSQAAILDLHERIAREFMLNGEEEKNSDSPPGSSSPPSGSATPSETADAGDGKWTESNTGPTPADGSASTPETSSASTPASEAPPKTARRRGRTGAR